MTPPTFITSPSSNSHASASDKVWACVCGGGCAYSVLCVMLYACVYLSVDAVCLFLWRPLAVKTRPCHDSRVITASLERAQAIAHYQIAHIYKCGWASYQQHAHMHVFMHAVYSICTRIDKWGGGGGMCMCRRKRERGGGEKGRVLGWGVGIDLCLRIYCQWTLCWLCGILMRLCDSL